MSDPTNDAGHLTIGGVDSLQLAEQFQTPLYVYDVSAIRDQIRAFKRVFEAQHFNYAVSYASKAFATIAMYQVAKQEACHVDVVSGGELYTAAQADFPMADVSFHGNNKSEKELREALALKVGTIVVDNFYELQLLGHLLAETPERTQNILLRVTPGISAHTHAYISTGQTDSKFGFDVDSGLAFKAAKLALANPQFNLLGIHAHIGSQIFDVAGFIGATQKLANILKDWHEQLDYTPSVLNVGGGFGIAYTKDDDPIPAEDFVEAILKTLRAQNLPFDLPAVWIEPGRSIVGPAGFQLYTVGSSKNVEGLRPYIAIDGGMGDNLRPALYQAEYEAVKADDPNAQPTQDVHLVGKYCESGDILINHAHLPAVQPGDVLAVKSCGAYGYSMASNYNRNPIPAVVFAENGQAKLVVRRQSYADLTQNDLSYD
ncbi:diaminopimelate decarboxylase [Lacticaseibacillus manihotivorans]|jgi:diaminopimelate decarboxylase|uniref:Diaminopimelate decarboxylase n=2 Tax=Lacticaseibacillus manihotivorans TaxID=88233 RepID=A0A0R1QFV4_9LACO|nr:diaminopimelate decarboxylase [Lacticaseibacillus manihotivorans]KRL43735.1 diaminopimelate decarboxylase [Lacticaseibacillus manihotivorans DSM 13343 = JCM 12514]QFQ90065.1 diaminopimelate decarboxylase [Lacticaseibacillus manihotivorans]